MQLQKCNFINKFQYKNRFSYLFTEQRIIQRQLTKKVMLLKSGSLIPLISEP